MKSIEKLKKELEQIEEQNKQEDRDIAWKNSGVRHLLIALFIYFVLGFAIQINNYPNAWINALVPSIGFLIIIFSLTFVKKFWGKYIYKEKQ